MSIINKNPLTLLAIFIVIVSIPVTVYLAQKQQIFKGRTTGSLNVGVNVTGITHYGKNDLLPYASASHITANLNEVRRMGGRVIRVFVANKFISDTEAANRLDAFLTTATTYNISVIATLIDFYNSGFGPQGVSYNRCDFNPCLLGEDFFGTSGSNSFRNRYKQFVQTVVNKNKPHSNIYAWEIGNELKYEHDSGVFITFMNEMSSFIKSLDPNRPISTGMMYAAHMGMSASDLYSRLSNFDIISIHTYNANHQGAEDAIWARSNGKRIIISEIGFDRTNDRSGNMRNELNYWKSQGASAVLQWGFIARGLGDNGDGDRSSGMDTIWHSDYDNLASVFSYFNGISPTPTPTPRITPSPTPRITPTPTSRPTPTPAPTPSGCFARDRLTGRCRQFPSPCKIPLNWEVVPSCKGSIIF